MSDTVKVNLAKESLERSKEVRLYPENIDDSSQQTTARARLH